MPAVVPIPLATSSDERNKINVQTIQNYIAELFKNIKNFFNKYILAINTIRKEPSAFKNYYTLLQVLGTDIIRSLKFAIPYIILGAWKYLFPAIGFISKATWNIIKTNTFRALVYNLLLTGINLIFFTLKYVYKAFESAIKLLFNNPSRFKDSLLILSALGTGLYFTVINSNLPVYIKNITDSFSLFFTLNNLISNILYAAYFVTIKPVLFIAPSIINALMFGLSTIFSGLYTIAMFQGEIISNILSSLLTTISVQSLNLANIFASLGTNAHFILGAGSATLAIFMSYKIVTSETVRNFSHDILYIMLEYIVHSYEKISMLTADNIKNKTKSLCSNTTEKLQELGSKVKRPVLWAITRSNSSTDASTTERKEDSREENTTVPTVLSV